MQSKKPLVWAITLKNTFCHTLSTRTHRKKLFFITKHLSKAWHTFSIKPQSQIRQIPLPKLFEISIPCSLDYNFLYLWKNIFHMTHDRKISFVTQNIKQALDFHLIALINFCSLNFNWNTLNKRINRMIINLVRLCVDIHKNIFTEELAIQFDGRSK